MATFEETLEELHRHLDCDNQNWLFGAGISFESKVPLMSALTKRVEALLQPSDPKELYGAISGDLPDTYNIEHVLSHVGDLIALSERSKQKEIEYKGTKYFTEILVKLHSILVNHIGETVRYGYVGSNPTSGVAEEIGTITKPIVKIENHRSFVTALLSLKANLISRSSISIFTTNYDTLLEDALALEKLKVNDGFSGAAIGFWNPLVSFEDPSGVNVFKLHGSVDWFKDNSDGLVRNRYGVTYITNSSSVLIYPQATKYVETQKDPFASLFMNFRKRLNSNSSHILVSAGYSYGDNHINCEIEDAMKTPGNKTILIVFAEALNETLTSWLSNEKFSKKIFIACPKGIYHGSPSIISRKPDDNLCWWKFTEFVNFLKNGEVK